MSAHPRRSLAVAAATVVAAVTLAGCTSPTETAETVAGQLPDLTEYGYTQVECGTGVTINEEFVTPEAPYVAQCWEGVQDDPFVWVVDDLKVSVIQATEGVDASAQACAEDVLNEAAGIACRAVYVGEDGNDVLVRIIVALADIDAVMAKVPAEDPTSEDVIAALAGAELEVLIGTEPIPDATASPSA